MKIIGKTDSDGFIVTATGDELAKICGFAYLTSMPNDKRPSAGMEIKVTELYRALVVSRERKNEIAELANKLRTAAGGVDSINQALAAPIVEVEVKG